MALELMKDMNESRWHAVNSSAAHQLTLATNSPGVVHPISRELLPEQIKKMSGVSSYYISGYVSPEAISNGKIIHGEMVVARRDGDLTKNYVYLFAVSSEGNVLFSGPSKGFGHHVASGQHVEVNSLFGQTSLGHK